MLLWPSQQDNNRLTDSYSSYSHGSPAQGQQAKPSVCAESNVIHLRIFGAATQQGNSLDQAVGSVDTKIAVQTGGYES